MGGINSKTCERKRSFAISNNFIPISKIPEFYGIKKYLPYRMIAEKKLIPIVYQKIICIKKDDLEKFLKGSVK